MKDKKWYALDKEGNVLDFCWSISSFGASQRFESKLDHNKFLEWVYGGNKIVSKEEYESDE